MIVVVIRLLTVNQEDNARHQQVQEQLERENVDDRRMQEEFERRQQRDQEGGAPSNTPADQHCPLHHHANH